MLPTLHILHYFGPAVRQRESKIHKKTGKFRDPFTCKFTTGYVYVPICFTHTYTPTPNIIYARQPPNTHPHTETDTDYLGFLLGHPSFLLISTIYKRAHTLFAEAAAHCNPCFFALVV